MEKDHFEGVKINTDYLELLERPNQEEVLKVLAEIFAIGAASTPLEADSAYRTVIKKILADTEDAETLDKLITLTSTVWKKVKQLLPKE